jgi:hypothetical protein
MSFKRQLQFKYQNFVNFLKSLSLPEWMTGVAVRATLSVLVMGLSMAYILQTSSAAIRGYEMASLEEQITGLETDIQKVGVETAKYSSLAILQTQLKDTKMVAAGAVKHLTVSGNEMAKK